MIALDKAQEWLAGQSPEGRADIARRAGAAMWTHKSIGDLRAAEALARELCRDAVAMVRAALAEAVRDVPYLPHDIALTLAQDSADIASRFLIETPALDDEQLADLVPDVEESACTAIASRRRVSRKLCRVLIDRAPEASVRALAGNAGANIGSEEIRRAAARFPDSRGVLQALTSRGDLDAALLDDLISQIFNHFAARVRDRAVATDPADQLTERFRERTQLQVIAALHEKSVPHYARSLRRRNALTDGLLVQAAQAGYIRFLEAALAARAEIPPWNVRRLLCAGGAEGIARLFEKAGVGAEGRRDVLASLSPGGNPE